MGECVVAFDLVAVAMCKLAVVGVVGVAAEADGDYFVYFGAHWVWCFEVFVDGFAADVAGVLCC